MSLLGVILTLLLWLVRLLPELVFGIREESTGKERAGDSGSAAPPSLRRVSAPPPPPVPPRAPAPPPRIRPRVAAPPKPQYVGKTWAQTRGEHAQCQVCGVPLRDEVVACPTCATLHHEDCWDFAGGCSTYACTDRRA